MATNALGWLRNRPRFALAILFVVTCSYAIDRWFFSGAMASKWIGLPQYEQAMKDLQKQSGNWGIVALAFGIVAFVLILPQWPSRSEIEATRGILTASPESNIWIGYFGQCLLRAGIMLFGTFGLAVIIPIAAYFLHRFLNS
jgi:hypothetical protein